MPRVDLNHAFFLVVAEISTRGWLVMASAVAAVLIAAALARPFVDFLGLWIVPLRRLPSTGHCQCCGYLLTGLRNPRCPECGRPCRLFTARQLNARHLARFVAILSAFCILLTLLLTAITMIDSGMR